MVDKDEVIVLRISGDSKAAIKSAAAGLGQSMTTFIGETIDKRVRALKRRPPKRAPTYGIHEGVPTFFRACCLEASRGGENGYRAAGWHLANSITNGQQPHDIESDDWESEIDALKELLASEDEVGAWDWFKRHYPKCMALVPGRRREQFIAGVRQAHEDGRIEV